MFRLSRNWRFSALVPPGAVTLRRWKHFPCFVACMLFVFAIVQDVCAFEGKPRTIEEVLDEWTVPAISAVSLFETGSIAQYGKIATDFDCQGLSMGILQWTINSGGVYQLFNKVDNEVIKEKMGDSYNEFEKFLTLLNQGHNKSDYSELIEFVRQWQTPRFDRAAANLCSINRARGPLLFKPEKEKLLNNISALLQSQPLIDRQNALAREKARCVYHVAKAWHMRLESGQFQTFFKTCKEAQLTEVAKKAPDGATMDHPSFRDFLFFYDVIVQVGVGSLSSMMDVAALVPAEAPETSIGTRFLNGRLYNDFRTALAWLATCWDWTDGKTACTLVQGLSGSEKLQYLKSMLARSDALSRQDRQNLAVLSNHVEALWNAEQWGRSLDAWQHNADASRLTPTQDDKSLRDETERIRLGMFSFLTSLLSYRNYSVNVMNRKATLVFGRGCAVGRRFDFNRFYDAIESKQAAWFRALEAANLGSCFN